MIIIFEISQLDFLQVKAILLSILFHDELDISSHKTDFHLQRYC